ncbi:hypothetical protein DER46DRAFT_633053 [Fusarium sp. MPI-SDFR-AT-0072]|nr:hypothetical protein DER46DRAFT_633053 [Fusarium sp. MPI-SDFR-AT-0072]
MAPARISHDPVLRREPATQSRDFQLRTLNSDLCVCGGGLAGTIAAIAAARNGVSVILIQDRPVLGGNASSEVRLWILGATSHMFNNNRYAREGGLVDEILLENLYRNPEGNPLILDTILLEKVRLEPNIQLFLNTALVGCEKDGDRISSVSAFNSQSSLKFTIQSQQFIDCTGDGTLSFLAGAPFRIGAEKRDEFNELFAPSSEYGHLLGHSIYFYTKDTGKPVKYVAPAYALKDVEGEIPRFKSFSTKEMGCNLWWIEYGGRLDTIHDTEQIKWELWKVVYGVWDYFKNSGRFPEAENLTLEWVGTIPGKRESRRFIGPTIMVQQDIVEQRYHSDAVSFGGWSLDLHPADGVFSEVDGCTQWHSKGVYQIPFSSMVCSEIPNLMYGGRIMSASHVAFASTRVMATCGANANALGIAASLCKKQSVDPMELLVKSNMKNFQRELMRFGQFIPGYKLNDPEDLVRSASKIEGSSFELSQLPANGPPKVLVRSLAQMLPLSQGSVPTFSITAMSVDNTVLTVQLRGSQKPYNYTPEVILAETKFPLVPGQNDLVIDFKVENPQTQYVFLSFLQNDSVALCTSKTRVSALMTVEHECTQSPPSDVGVDEFERWTPVRRPMGHNLALTLDTPLKAWGVENICNGVPRPTKRTNCWVPRADSYGRKILKIGWDIPVKVNKVVVHFDTDYDHALESVLRGHPERTIPFCVKKWRLLDLSGEERELPSKPHFDLPLQLPASTKEHWSLCIFTKPLQVFFLHSPKAEDITVVMVISHPTSFFSWRHENANQIPISRVKHLMVPEILNNTEVISTNAANEARLQSIRIAVTVFDRRHRNERKSATNLNNLGDQRSMRPWESQQPGNAPITRHERHGLNTPIFRILQPRTEPPCFYDLFNYYLEQFVIKMTTELGAVPAQGKMSGWLFFSIFVISMGSIFWGYDIGILSTIYVSPGFNKALNHPSSSEKGLITAIFAAGQFASFALIAGPINNKYGRRWAGFGGVCLLCVGAAIQTGAVHLAMMVIGRIIAGVGTGVVSTAVPLYLSEISPAKHRGLYVAANQVGIVSGISMAFWVGYGYSFWDYGNGIDLEWRLSTAMQFVPALLFLGGVLFIPESPRWLVETDQVEAASESLCKLRGLSAIEIQPELDEIRANILWHQENSITSARVFIQQKPLWSRLWRAWSLAFLQQMSGAAGIRYYLPTNFIAAGTSEELSLLASGIDGTVQVVCTVAAMFFIDKLGRRHSLGIGAIIMAFCLMINGALQTAYPGQNNQSANYVNIFFIFFFTVGYSMGFGPCAWIYASEIFPANCRSKGLAISSSGSSLGSIIVGQVWPVAVSRIGPRVYFIFMAFNVFAAILVYACYPETKNKTLEELDSHFGSLNVHSEEDATPKQMLGAEEERVEVRDKSV